MVWPWLMQWMRSLMDMMTRMMCSTITTVTPLSRIFLIRLMASSSSPGLRPAAVSSSSSRVGRVAMARVISRRLRLAMESPLAKWEA